MEKPKVKLIGTPCGQHGSYTFYKAFKFSKDGKEKIVSLGEFFFTKILNTIPVCIAELQLLWEDRSSSHTLSSVRLYFLPQDTPDGRQSHHGEDEILSLSEKIVIKLEDLVPLITFGVTWTDGHQAFCESDLPVEVPQHKIARSFSFGHQLEFSDIDKEREQIGDKPDTSSTEVTIMSFSRYCRYRAMLKRLENCPDKWLRNTIVCAIGGFIANTSNNRVLFCRNTYDHPDLDDFEHRCDHLAPNLKGRPRKRKMKRENSAEDSESNESLSSTATFSPVQKVRIGKRASALRNGFRLDKEKVSKEEQEFLISLHKFMKNRNTPIERIPCLGFKQIDLYSFYKMAMKIGGYEQITMKRMWKHLYDSLGGNPGSTSAATCTRRHYERLLLPYEQYMMGESDKPILKRKKKLMFDHLLSKEKIETGMVKMRKKRLKLVKMDSKNGEKQDVLDKEAKENKKIRKSGSGQKTVRELLDENSKSANKEDAQKQITDLPKEETTPSNESVEANIRLDTEIRLNPDSAASQTIETTLSEKVDVKVEPVVKVEQGIMGSGSVPQVPMQQQSQTQQTGTLSIGQHGIPLSGVPSVFYPHHIMPMTAPLRAMHPMGIPVMIPAQFGFPMNIPVQSLPSHMAMETKPLNALNDMVSNHIKQRNQETPKDPQISEVKPPHVSQSSQDRDETKTSPSLIAAHQIVRTSSLPSSHDTIVPAHSNGLNRSYSLMDANSNIHKYHIPNVPTDQVSLHVSSSSEKCQRQPYAPYSSSGLNNKLVVAGSDDQPTDLSMKTLRALEAQNQQESNSVYNKENKSDPKNHECSYSVPQDLSLKPKPNNAIEAPKRINSHSLLFQAPGSKNVPLNVPFCPPRSHATHQYPLGTHESHLVPSRRPQHETMDTVSRENGSKYSDGIKQYLSVSSAAPVSSATAVGLPGMSHMVHPAFPHVFMPPPMLQPGLYTGPIPLPPMMQGMLRPEFHSGQMLVPSSAGIFSQVHSKSVPHSR
ncbi:hypothetical protein CHS0354_006144 [Potamilus streckersoni]|uniref:ARID domain-containing protein n=1 Tax=Potamilus streckersoni TaxID=2493646 RepID=A0AAE0SU23_9BIVA|nr:hypothetical protein CHS0354_006144 [Potamilus streckersoni]